jgi:hypothetical protein
MANVAGKAKRMRTDSVMEAELVTYVAALIRSRRVRGCILSSQRPTRGFARMDGRAAITAGLQGSVCANLVDQAT